MDKAAVTCQTAETKRHPLISLAPFGERLRRLFTKSETDTVPMTAEKRALLKELDETLRDLRCARANFEQAYAPEIVEACIYEIKSAESRYNFLLRKAKQTGLSQPYVKY